MSSYISNQRRARWTRRVAAAVVLSVLIAAFTMSVWAATESAQERAHRECARLAARAELLRRHWQALETASEFHPVIDAIFQETLASPKDSEWQVKVVNPASIGSSEYSNSERGDFRQVESGSGEVFTSRKGEMVGYVSAVRLAESCTPCHRVLKGQDKPLNVGDVIAFVSVQRAATKKAN